MTAAEKIAAEIIAELSAAGVPPETVAKVLRLVAKMEEGFKVGEARWSDLANAGKITVDDFVAGAKAISKL